MNDEQVINIMMAMLREIREDVRECAKKIREEMEERVAIREQLRAIVDSRPRLMEDMRRNNTLLTRVIWVVSGAIAVLAFLDIPEKIKMILMR